MDFFQCWNCFSSLTWMESVFLVAWLVFSELASCFFFYVKLQVSKWWIWMNFRWRFWEWHHHMRIDVLLMSARKTFFFALGRSLMAPRAFRWSPNTTGNGSWHTWMLRCSGENLPDGVLVDSWLGWFSKSFYGRKTRNQEFFLKGRHGFRKTCTREVRMKSSFCIYLSHCVDLFWTQWYCWAKSWCFKRTKSTGVTIGWRRLQAKRVELLGVVVGCLWEGWYRSFRGIWLSTSRIKMNYPTLPKTNSLHLKIDL